MMFTKSRLAKIVVVVMVALSMVACQKKATEKKPGSKKSTIAAHSISAADEKLVMTQTEENIDILTGVTTNTDALKKALTGPALTAFSDQIKKDLGEGKIKIRKYDSVKLEIRNVTTGVVGLKMTFTDRSYYEDKDSKEKLSSPAGTKETFILVSKKVGKRWKIFNFLTTKLKNEDKKE